MTTPRDEKTKCLLRQICDKNWHAAANTMTNQTYDRHMSIIIVHSSQSRTPFAGERRFSKSRGLSASVSFLPLPHPPPSYFALDPFFAQTKRQNHRSSLFCATETLATQATAISHIHAFMSTYLTQSIESTMTELQKRLLSAFFFSHKETYRFNIHYI